MVGLALAVMDVEAVGEGDVHAAPYSVWQPSRQYSGVDPHQPFLRHDVAECEENPGGSQALRHTGSDKRHTDDGPALSACVWDEWQGECQWRAPSKCPLRARLCSGVTPKALILRVVALCTRSSV